MQAANKEKPDLPVTKMSLAEIEPKLLQIFRDRLWRRDRAETRRIIGMIDRQDIAKALEIVDHNCMGQARRILRIDLLNAWARLDPAAAAAWLNRLPQTEAQHEERIIISDIWSQKDPEAALAFAGPTPSAFRNLVLRSPEAAAHTALAVQDARGRAIAIETVAKAWFDADPNAAVKWASELPDMNDRYFGLRSLIDQLAKIDPSSVAAYVATLPSGPPFSMLEQSLAAQWAGIDPAAAAAWAGGLPTSSGSRQDTFMQIAQEWAEDDPKAAAAWIETLPISPAREAATQAFLYRALNYDPAIAAEWAVKLTDENARSDAIAAVAIRWLSADRPAAEAWLALINVPDNARKKMSAEGFANVGGKIQPP